MKARDEQAMRLALKRRRKLSPMSDEGFAELERAVRSDPERFIDDAEEEAFAILVNALETFDRESADDDLLSENEYRRARDARHAKIVQSCARAHDIFPDSIDAELIRLLATCPGTDQCLRQLLELERTYDSTFGALEPGPSGDAWVDVFARPRLRMLDAIARCCLATGRYVLAGSRAEDLLRKAPLDVLGARYTLALVFVRLEDEDAFLWLDGQERWRSNAWFHLCRVILMYKLGRMPAARRALRGYDQLCEGGAYALLQPILLDTYLPDRPEAAPLSFRECLLAVHEAEPVIDDVPELINWSASQDQFLASARAYGESHGMEWRDW